MDEAKLKGRVEAWIEADPDPAAQSELRDLVARGDPRELEDRFAGGLEFGTAGLRGVVGAGPNRMNRAVVRRTTLGLARYLKSRIPEVAQRGVVVARDGRRMSPEFAADTASVLAAVGIPALVFDTVAPTPVCAFAVVHLGAAAGVMVTASHNPAEYNGYKVYWGNGAQIIPPNDVGIAAAIADVGPARTVDLLPEREARTRGLWRDLGEEVARAYLDGVLAHRLHPGKGTDLRIVYTAMHGVGGPWAVRAFTEAGFGRVAVVAEQQEPDATFPTVRFPNPEEPGAMDLARALAERIAADLVLANDPDADRLAVLARDAGGMLVQLTGNEVGVLLGHHLLTAGPKLARPLVMTTIVSSVQLRAIAKRLGAEYDETLTGFKWIANRAIERAHTDGSNFVFGYEEALGYTVGTLVRDKDGIGAALAMADLAGGCRARGTTVLGYLEEIQRAFGLYLSAQRSFTLPGSTGAQTIAGVLERFRAEPPTAVGSWAVEGVKDYQTRVWKHGGRTEPLSLPASNVLAYELAGGAQVTVRPSGTEPKIKYYFELPEQLAAGEPMHLARSRAEASLGALERDFLALAAARGQPRG